MLRESWRADAQARRLWDVDALSVRNTRGSGIRMLMLALASLRVHNLATA